MAERYLSGAGASTEGTSDSGCKCPKKWPRPQQDWRREDTECARRREPHSNFSPEPGKEKEEGDGNLPKVAEGTAEAVLWTGAKKLVETRTETRLPIDTPVLTPGSWLLGDLP